MARGRRSTLTITLTAEERHTLEQWQRAHTLPAGQARHARMILLRAAGCSIAEIEARVGLARHHVYKWLRRFQAQGVAGLIDQRGAARRRRPPARKPVRESRTAVFRFALNQVVRWAGNPEHCYQIGQRRFVEGRTGTCNEYGLQDQSRAGLCYLTWVNEADVEETP